MWNIYDRWKKRLIKKISKYEPNIQTNMINNYLVIQPKYDKELIELYHLKSGLKGINNFGQLISNDGYYIVGMYKLINQVIKDCIIYNQNKKNIFEKQNIVQIIPKGLKFEYKIDLTEVPEKLSKSENKIYIISIIDTFSKYGGCYLLNNKKGETLLGYIKDFIYKYGKPNVIHSDNGKEFCNSLFDDYCYTNNIIIIRGRPHHHPQSQGIVESFNKEIKRLLENKYL